MRRPLAPLSSMVLALGCATADCPEPPRPPEPAAASEPAAADADEGAEASLVVLVRHAEKAADGTADPPLTERGVRRAECLAHMLGDAGITALYATQYQRTQATVAPLAAALGREVTIIEAQDDAGWARLLESVEPGARIVVAGHSNTLPGLVGSMGGRLLSLDDKGNIPDDDYDRMVHVSRQGSGPAAIYTTRYCAE